MLMPFVILDPFMDQNTMQGRLCKLYKTDDQYHPEPYQVDDFYVGSRIQVFGRTLELISTDERSQKNLSDINQCVARVLLPAPPCC